jgi:hypothetical protein
LIAQLTWFFHWSPRDAWGLTGTEIMWWVEQANRIHAKQNPPRED